MTRWWGYLHVNGKVILKRYFDRDAIEDAEENTSIDRVYGPFSAPNRTEAEIKLKKKLS